MTKQVMPALTDAEQRSLEEMIQLTGVVVPVIKANDEILDGLHRKMACQKLGRKTPVIDLGKIPEARADLIRYAMNLVRRQVPYHIKGALVKKMMEVMDAVKAGDQQENERSSETPTLGFPSQLQKVATTTIAEAAKAINEKPKNVEHMVAAADAYAKLPPPAKAKVDAGEMSVATAVKKEKAKAGAVEPETGKKIVPISPHPNEHIAAANADLDDLRDAVKQALSVARRVFKFENKGHDGWRNNTPYLTRFSYVGVVTHLLEYLRMIEDYRPVGGTKDKPTVKLDEQMAKARNK